MPARTAELNLISVDAAAKRLGLHHRTIRRYLATGKLQGHRVAGWAVRVSQDDVDALVRPITNGRG